MEQYLIEQILLLIINYVQINIFTKKLKSQIKIHNLRSLVSHAQDQLISHILSP